MIKTVLFAMFLFLGWATACAAQSDSAKGRLRTFENRINAADTLPGDSPKVRERSELDTSSCLSESDTGTNILGEIVFFIPKLLIQACVEAYTEQPYPNYGPYPYCNGPGFTLAGANEPATYAVIGAGYQHTYSDIATMTTKAELFANSFVLAASYGKYREQISSLETNSLELAAVRLGVRKAMGGHLVWRNHLGWRYMKGSRDRWGGIAGMEWKIFTEKKFVVTIGYDINFFPGTGTACHDCDLGISYYLGRLEWKAGYQSFMINRGPSLHGPYLGLSWNF